MFVQKKCNNRLQPVLRKILRKIHCLQMEPHKALLLKETNYLLFFVLMRINNVFSGKLSSYCVWFLVPTAFITIFQNLSSNHILITSKICFAKFLIL